MHNLQEVDVDLGERLSADVDIVAYNIGKNISAIDLKNWLSEKRIFVKECSLLTKFENARSLSYKLTIKPQDFDRVMQDESIWPYRVGVRLFKNRRNIHRREYKHRTNRPNGEGNQDLSSIQRLPQRWRERTDRNLPLRWM